MRRSTPSTATREPKRFVNACVSTMKSFMGVLSEYRGSLSTVRGEPSYSLIQSVHEELDRLLLREDLCL